MSLDNTIESFKILSALGYSTMQYNALNKTLSKVGCSSADLIQALTILSNTKTPTALASTCPCDTLPNSGSKNE